MAVSVDGLDGGGVDVRALLPADVRDNVLLVFGERGRAWIESLPEVVAELLARWHLQLDATRAYGGGTHSLVVAVARAGGEPAALKVPVQDEENRAEAAALRLYAGDGAVLLHESDAASGGLLLERLEPCAALIDHPDRDMAIDVACALLRRLQRPVPAGHPFPLVVDLVRRWSQAIEAARARHGRPLLPDPVERVTEAALDALAVPLGGEVLVNRDGHLGNIMAARREPWLLIDPKPLVGEPAFDAGWLLIDLVRATPTPEVGERLVRRVAGGLGVDPERARAWAVLRAVEDVLWDIERGSDPLEYVTIATAFAGGL
jgi:streptomycin 6-kinase